MLKNQLALFAAGIVLALSLTLSCSSGDDSGGNNGSYGSVYYEGQTYKTVLIGTQTWMAENLNYAASGSKCYGNKPENCQKYGRLYDWSTAKKACPSGWHLPSKAEWEVLGNDSKKLKAKSGWNSGGNGTDQYGFSALPGGNGDSIGSFNAVGISGYWWSADESDSDGAYRRDMYYSCGNAYWYYSLKSFLFSVRCVQD